MFSTNLSDEYAIAAKTFNLSHDEVWALSEAAIDYTFASDTTKGQLSHIWQEIKTSII